MTRTAQYKTALRDAVLPLLNTGVSEATILALIDTARDVCNPNDIGTLSPLQVINTLNAIERCDVACGFGPGHQSTVLCDRRGPHGAYHYNRSHRIEWADKDISPTQTHEHRGKTYRLAFSNEGWY